MLPKEDAETVSKKFSFLTVALLAYTAFCAVVAYNKAYTLPVAMVQGSVALSASKCLDGGLSQLFLLPCLEQAVAVLPFGLFALACRADSGAHSSSDAVLPGPWKFRCLDWGGFRNPSISTAVASVLQSDSMQA